MTGTAAFISLVLTLLIRGSGVVIGRERPDPVSPWISAAALGALLAELVVRSAAIRFTAVTGTYEALLLFAVFLVAVGLVFRRRTGLFLGLNFLAFALLALASSPVVPSELRPPVPALRSAWLVLHVVLAFLGEALFAAAFVAALIRLADRRRDPADLDALTSRLILIGFPIYTLGALVFGAVWAWHAWGRFWGWDPKETWALVTWLTYAWYLHIRLIGRKRDRLAAMVAVLGFLFTIFTFLGVNYLLPGLHSYL